MIDIHSHILWGVDDGAKDFERSLKMLDLAKADGIDVIFTTSHYSGDLPGLLPARLEELRPHAVERGITLIAGSEIDYVHLNAMPSPMTMGDSKFILVDMRQPFLEMSVPHVFSRLSMNGYTVIIAHPERLFAEPDLKTVRTLAEMDCLFQINASSLAGTHGSRAKRIALEIIKNGFAHYAGSDAHSLRRPFYMTDARKVVNEKFGSEVAELLFEENARQLIDGKAPFKVIPPRRRWYQFFSR